MDSEGGEETAAGRSSILRAYWGKRNGKGRGVGSVLVQALAHHGHSGGRKWLGLRLQGCCRVCRASPGGAHRELSASNF